MKKVIALLLLIGSSNLSLGQTVYVDVVTPAAFMGYSAIMKDGQDKSNSRLSKIETAQIFAAGQLKIANDLHDKMIRGLSEVSGTLKNGLTIKSIYEEMRYTIDYLEEALRLGARQPALLLVARESMSDFRQRTLSLTSEVTSIITGGNTNLMTAGERQKLLDNIYTEVRLLAASAYTIKDSMYWASKFGIWKSLNPFTQLINQDRIIMQDIIRNSKMF